MPHFYLQFAPEENLTLQELLTQPLHRALKNIDEPVTRDVLPLSGNPDNSCILSIAAIPSAIDQFSRTIFRAKAPTSFLRSLRQTVQIRHHHHRPQGN